MFLLATGLRIAITLRGGNRGRSVLSDKHSCFSRMYLTNLVSAGKNDNE